MQNKAALWEAEKYITQEIEIIKPKLIVPVGKSYKKVYEKILTKFGISLSDPVLPHYAPQFNNYNKKKKFRKALREVKKIFKKRSRHVEMVV